jgi:hypothetical protein
MEVAHPGVQEPGALLASSFQDAQDRAPVEPGEAFRGADAHSLTEQVNHLESLCGVNPHRIQGPLWNVQERPAAHIAAITLKALGIDSEFDRFILAPMTRHFGLAFLRPIP